MDDAFSLSPYKALQRGYSKAVLPSDRQYMYSSLSPSQFDSVNMIESEFLPAKQNATMG